MNTRLLFIISSLLAIALGVMSIIGLPEHLKWWGAGIGAVLVLLLAAIYHSTIKPVIVARRGLEMLRSQDFNVRLMKVGTPEADKIVDLFNHLITKLKNERLRLREQDTFLHLLIDASPMGVIMVDLDERITMVNPALLKIAEISKSDSPAGAKLQDVGSAIITHLAAIAPGESATIRLDGSRLYRGYHLWFLQEGFRRHFYLVESLTDEVRRAEKAAYEKVIRMMAHEVNNTMGSVQTVLDILAEDYTDDPDISDTIGSCRQRTEQMCGFIDEFANLARIPESDRKPLDLNAEIQRLMPFLRVMVPEHITVTFDPHTAAAPVLADAALLQQVLVNIVKNAAESFGDKAPQGSFIRIHTARCREITSLTISNNGIPISPEVAARLFTPFFSTKRSGRGLGLTLISEVLSKHGCTFTLASDTEGITTFDIKFEGENVRY